MNSKRGGWQKKCLLLLIDSNNIILKYMLTEWMFERVLFVFIKHEITKMLGKSWYHFKNGINLTKLG